jgi:hypothetical protein
MEILRMIINILGIVMVGWFGFFILIMLGMMHSELKRDQKVGFWIVFLFFLLGMSLIFV